MAETSKRGEKEIISHRKRQSAEFPPYFIRLPQGNSALLNFSFKGQLYPNKKGSDHTV